MTWLYGKRLVNYGGIGFSYDGLGRRISKGDVTFTYDHNERLLKQSNGLDFIYDNDGVTGFVYDGSQYFYRKDAQGNIIAILDGNGNPVVHYEYDAWGNHAVLDSDGNDITDENNIGLLNPYRYRGYYYDTETGLYFLQTRYYDPELGRFISQDSLKYANSNLINGLNLYAYCNDNPVKYIDPTGTFIFTVLLVGLAVFVVDTVVETAILMTSKQYKAENVVKRDTNGLISGVKIKNSAAFNNPIAQYVYANYLYKNVKNDDGTNYFTGDVYDIVGEWQAHNVAAYLTGIGMILTAIPSKVLGSGNIYEYLHGLHSKSIDLDMVNTLAAEGRTLVRVISQVFKWANIISSFNVLNW